MQSSLLDLSHVRQNVAQENPGTHFNVAFKRARNLAIRQRVFCKARFQEKLLNYIKRIRTVNRHR
jgi:hypothetical protein